MSVIVSQSKYLHYNIFIVHKYVLNSTVLKDRVFIDNQWLLNIIPVDFVYTMLVR